MTESCWFIRHLPLLNLALNMASTVTLLAGLQALRQSDIKRHRQRMVTASILLGLFLTGYVTRVSLVGVTKYSGTHPQVYHLLLRLHMSLAIPTLFYLVPRTLYWGLKNRIPEHRRFARLTALGWIASSITSVPVYFLLYVVRW